MPHPPQPDFTKLPIDREDVWQGGMFRFPSWVEPRGDRAPFRPWLAIWCSGVTGHAFSPKLGEDPARDAGLLIGALRETFRKAGREASLPARLQVSDPEDAAIVRAAVEGTGVIVEVADRLEAFTEFRDEMRKHARQDQTIDPLTDDPEISVEQVRSFAEAAAAFYLYEPWDHFDQDDLIEIECDLADAKLRLATVMGSGNEEFGIFFMESQEQYDSILSGTESDGRIVRLGGDWGVTFCPPYEIPVAEHDLWEDHGLPLADADAYPCPVRIGPSRRVGRPNARQLAYFEGLMRALTQSTEDEMDSGRWEKTVSTSSGMTTIRLRLPGVLADEAGDPAAQSGLRTDRRGIEKGISEIQRFMATQNFSNIEEAEAAIQSRFLGRSIDSFPSTAATPLERAQEIMYDAFEARGRTRIKLARRALAISPDCADAYGLLAARTNNLDKARDLLKEAVAAGERAVRSLGIDAGEIAWGDIRCRPYLRARFALAGVLRGFGEVEDALREFVEILRTDPDDHQGVRYELLTLLLELKKDREAHALLEQFPDEGGALWPYARALLAYRQEGGSAEADRLADRALKANPFMWKFLAGTQDPPFDVPEAYRPGSREEAIVFAEDLAPIWQDTPGAAEWIRSRGRSRSKEKAGGGKSGAGGRGKPKGPKKQKPR